MEQSELRYNSNPNTYSRTTGTRTGTRTTNRSQTLGDSTIGFTSGDEIPLQTRAGTDGSFTTSKDFKVKVKDHDDEGAVKLDVITMTRSDFESHHDV